MTRTYDIYEGPRWTLVLSHVFHGRSERALDGLVRAHMATDSFFRAALERGQWRGIPLRVVVR